MLLAKFKTFLGRITTNENVVKNIFWLLGDKMLRYSVSLVVTVWLARYLGPDNNGILSYALFFTSLFGSFVGFGMSTIAVTEISRHPERENSVLGTAAFLMLGGAIISFLLQIILIEQIRPGDTVMLGLILIIGFSYLLKPLDISLTISYISRPEYKPVVIAANIGFILSSILKIIAILYKRDIWAFAVITTIESAAGCVLLLWHYQRKSPGIGNWRFEKKLFSQYLKQGFPLLLASLSADINNRIDLVMVADMHSNHEAGIYSVAVTLVQAWYFLPVIVYNVLFPNLVKLAENNSEAFHQKLQKFYNYMAIISYSVCIPVTFFGMDIVKFLYGKDYLESGPVLSLLIWGAAFVNLGVPRNAYIYSFGYYRLQSQIVIISCISNVLLNLLLIPKYGAVGATIATLISYAYASFFSNFFHRKIRKNGWMILRALGNPKF